VAIENCDCGKPGFVAMMTIGSVLDGRTKELSYRLELRNILCVDCWEDELYQQFTRGHDLCQKQVQDSMMIYFQVLE